MLEKELAYGNNTAESKFVEGMRYFYKEEAAVAKAWFEQAMGGKSSDPALVFGSCRSAGTIIRRINTSCEKREK